MATLGLSCLSRAAQLFSFLFLVLIFKLLFRMVQSTVASLIPLAWKAVKRKHFSPLWAVINISYPFLRLHPTWQTRETGWRWGRGLGRQMQKGADKNKSVGPVFKHLEHVLMSVADRSLYRDDLFKADVPFLLPLLLWRKNSDFFLQVRFDIQRLHTWQLQKIERVKVKEKGGRVQSRSFRQSFCSRRVRK